MRVLRSVLVLVWLVTLGCCLEPGGDAAAPAQDLNHGKQGLADCHLACYNGNQEVMKCFMVCVDLALCFVSCEQENQEVNDCFTECQCMTQAVARVDDVLINSEEELESSLIQNNETIDRMLCDPNCRNGTEAETVCILGCLNGTCDEAKCAKDCQTKTLEHDDFCCETDTPDHVLCPLGCQNDLTICIPGCQNIDATLDFAILDHAIGLGHNLEDNKSVMNATYQGENPEFKLAKSDVEAIAEVYRKEDSFMEIYWDSFLIFVKQFSRECRECIRGLCTGPNTCTCQPGWKGKFCNKHEEGRTSYFTWIGGRMDGAAMKWVRTQEVLAMEIASMWI